MRTFICDSCEHVLFFENNRCIRCGSWLGFSVEESRILALGPPGAEGATAEGASEQPSPKEESNAAPAVYPAVKPGSGPSHYRLCKNTNAHNACNWLVDARANDEYCASCQLTEILPALVDDTTRKRWVHVEAAKRRLLYSLHQLRLPVLSRFADPEMGLSFRFPKATEGHPVVTGHARGVITLNIAEADHAFRENEREKLGEAYRTVLGHLRHEVGHYYWDLLVKDKEPWLSRVRELFGDDQQSYAEAINRHYESGPPANWSLNFISAYATMHPWEDWAETFAHYLHMVDTLETARSYDMTVRSPSLEGGHQEVQMKSLLHLDLDDFQDIFSRWYSLTFVLNGLSRSMGMPDSYPFSFSDTVFDKLSLVHELIQDVGSQRAESTGAGAGNQPADPSGQSQTQGQSQESG